MSLPLIFPPSSLPLFSAYGHGISLGSDYAGVSRGRGASRKRPKSTGAPRVVTVAWQLTYAQMIDLDFWLENSLETATLSFTAEVANQGPGRLFWSAKWLTWPRCIPRATPRGPEWAVTGQIILTGEGEALRPSTGEMSGRIVISRLGSATLVLPETPLAGTITIARIAITPLAGQIRISRTSTILPLAGRISIARTGSGALSSGGGSGGAGTIDVGEEDGSPLQAVDTILFPSGTITYDSNGAAVYTPSGASGPSGVNLQTGAGTYTLVLTDADVVEVQRSNAAANNVTVPPNSSVAFSVGAAIGVRMLGAGQTSVVAGSGVTVNTLESLNLLATGALAVLLQTAADVWWLTGELLPVPATSYKQTQTLYPANSTTAGSLLGIVITSSTTVSHPTQALTNLLTATRRIRWSTAAGAGSASGFFETVLTKTQGNGAGLGGYSAEFVFGINTLNTTGHRVFIGFGPAAALGGDPSALVSMIGMGYDAADTSGGNWQFMHNDASGTATKVSLSSCPRNLTDLIYMRITAPSNGSDISALVVNLSTATTALSTTYSTDIPATNVFLSARAQAHNGAIATAASIDVASIVIGMQE